jgi:hypothetical protein
MAAFLLMRIASVREVMNEYVDVCALFFRGWFSGYDAAAPSSV